MILSLLRVPLAVLAVALFAASATAQTPKLSNRDYKDSQNGYRFQPPADWNATPIKPELQQLGLLYQMDTGRSGLRMFVLKLAPKVKDGERPELEQRLDFLLLSIGFKGKEVLEDEVMEIGGLEARHQQWEATSAYVDAWTFPLPEFDVALVYLVDGYERKYKRWLQLYRRSAKTFDLMEAEGVGEVSSSSSYEDQLTFHEAEAARTPGWRAVPTPSEKFIIKTSSDDDKFIKGVIERLELSRDLYERDFPPTEDFDHVSVVRVCASQEEFHRYGQTRPGVAGWFNPRTTELVLYDAKNTDRNATYSVMSHEAFHQYCHFLFGKSEAHRWFDEGHGDYYGGAEFKRGRAKITPQMPGGLDRLSVIREMIRSDSYAPIRLHLNFDHGEWQTQGPTNVSCYAQSWSIVYMLREGSLGRVSRKYWREEYAKIIPAYVETLNDGFRKAYAKERKERLAELEKEAGGKGRSVALDTGHVPLDKEIKEAIWETAVQTAWGGVNLDEFEESWRAYVIKGLK
jgi:hypothetical protein